MISDMKGEDLIDSENFTEAIGSAYRAWTPSTIPGSIRKILDVAAEMSHSREVFTIF